MFSPYYAAARRRGPADPEHFCAVNLALYGKTGGWCLTERGRFDLARTTDRLNVGPSVLSWQDGRLVLDLDEWTVPLPRRLRGRIAVTPQGIASQDFGLDPAGHHRWWPVAPCAAIEASFEKPALSWRGPGYLDHNAGDRPLEDDFRDWDWSRARLANGDTVILYDVRRRDGGTTELALRIGADGIVSDIDMPPAQPLPPGRIWRAQRRTRIQPPAVARIVETFEDTPFYTRSRLASHLCGEPVEAMHESLSLDRFRQRWVQTLLPFRMPRLAKRR